ncbi:uncharacterized protein LOC1278449 isoform X3 [Anopheles gambiae]|uniref:uncharacterized protein LOC1278449 isoform X3 n=1 Tax=Anopheles gambiae TaxID=7165 RepID=UPI002AC8C44E|nr:uncharacterized protein LOC1278449 isoform X3 [Anopheles gambiae]
MSGYLARNYGSRYISILSRVWSGNSQLMKNSEATLRKTLEAKFPQVGIMQRTLSLATFPEDVDRCTKYTSKVKNLKVCRLLSNTG